MPCLVFNYDKQCIKEKLKMLALVKKELIFPGSSEFCHAASIVQTRDGRFAAVWFAGLSEADSSTCIKLSIRSVDGVWRLPVTIAKIKYQSHWNPALFTLPSGRIALYFKVGKTIDAWKTYAMYSDESLEQWTEAVELVPGDTRGGRGPVKNPPILLSSGRILAPASIEINGWRAFIDRSDDGGWTWQASPDIPKPEIALEDKMCCNSLGLIQPTLWEDEKGVVHALMRSNNGQIYRSDSSDGGETWCEAYSTGLANNNSGICVAKCTDGRLILACNPIEGNWAARNILSLFVSADNGNSWTKYCDLENSASPDKDNPGNSYHFSYPTVISLPDNGFAVAYTHMTTSHAMAFALGKLE